MLNAVVGVGLRLITGDCIILAAGVLLVLYIVGTWNYDYFRRRGVASTAPSLPFAGDFFAMFTGRKSFLDSIKEIYEKGNGHGVFGAFEFQRPVFMVRDPEILKVVAVKDFDNFMNHRTIGSVETDPLFAKNLFNLRDQTWRDMRATLSPAFTTSKIKSMIPLMSKCTEQMVQHLHEKCNYSKEESTKEPLLIDMKDLFTRLANDVIATTAFGVSCDSLSQPENEFYHMGKTLTTFSISGTLVFFAFLLFPKLAKVIKIRMLNGKATNFFDSLVHETIRERQNKGILRPDVLQLLMQAREGNLKVDAKDSEEAEKVGVKYTKLSEEDISAQAMIFFLAGFETVSTGLSFTAYVLSHHPYVQKRLQEEITQIMEETDGKLDYESLQEMKYLDAVINETFRLYPPVPGTERVCQRDTTVPAGESSGSFTVSEGDIMSIPIIGLHYDPQYWDEPEKFNPDRFSEENKHKIKPLTYMPFGVGPRICIGQRLALIEVKLALVHLLANFDLHPCAKTKHPIEYLPGANITVRGGFWCGVTPRKPPGS